MHGSLNVSICTTKRSHQGFFKGKLEMKICSECKHFDPGGPVGYERALRGTAVPEAKCKHPDAQTRDMIFGQAYCAAERQSKSKDACGKEGRLWSTSK